MKSWGARSIVRRAGTAGRLATERMRAQQLRLRFPGVTVDRRARLGRGCRVHVAPGGELVLGPGTIADNVVIEVAANGRVMLTGKYIGPSCVVVGRTLIVVEAGVMIAEMSVLRDSDHLRDDAGAISDTGYASSPVQVGRDAWLGSKVTVLKGVTIGAGATVGAGAVVTRSVPAGATALGIPARVV